MAFAIGAANIPSLENWLTPGLTPRLDQALYATIETRQNSSSGSNDTETDTPTVNLFIDAVDEDFEYGASIINACADETIYAIQCTSAPSYIGRATCGPNGAVVTVTIASTSYVFSSAVTTSTLGSDVTATLLEACSLGGTTEAVCTATITGDVDGTAVSSAVTSTLTGSDYYRFDVPITAGAEKLASATTACNGAGSVVAGKIGIWALAGVVGVLGVQTLL